MELFYNQERAKVYLGDSRHLDALANNSIQMVITSPPYFNAKDYSHWKTYADYLEDMASVWRECFRVLCDGGRIAVNIPQGYNRPGKTGGYKPFEVDTTRSLIDCGFELRGHIIWYKENVGSNGTAWGSWMSAANPSLRDGHEVIVVAHKGRCSRKDGQSTITRDDFLECTKSVWIMRPQTNSWHPAPFPPELPRRLIQLYTFKDDIVLDPFAGSCTTVWEAAKAERYGIGVEARGDYIEQACGSMFIRR